jgi:predicted ATP-grasp superfamily ATP-dependent carboligase
MKRILVTGAGGSASFNYIQSLRDNPDKEQFYIVGCDSSKYHLELPPVDRRYLIPPCHDPAYITSLNQIIKKERIDFIHVQPDPEVLVIGKHREKLQAKTLLPATKTIETCQNKMAVVHRLAKKGISIAQSFPVSSEQALKTQIADLLKTQEKVWVRAIRGAGSKAALPVKSFDQAKMWIAYWREMKGLRFEDFMISEYLPGKEYAFQSFWINGELQMSQARERIAYVFGNLTPSGQSSSPSVAKTVHNAEVNELATKAVRTIDPLATGIFCVDMKTNVQGQVAVIEINAGRFFTTSYFFSAAGFNMPYYYTKYALGEQISQKPRPYNNLVKNLYWIRMIDMGYKIISEKKWTSKKIT